MCRESSSTQSLSRALGASHLDPPQGRTHHLRIRLPLVAPMSPCAGVSSFAAPPPSVRRPPVCPSRPLFQHLCPPSQLVCSATPLCAPLLYALVPPLCAPPRHAHPLSPLCAPLPAPAPVLSPPLAAVRMSPCAGISSFAAPEARLRDARLPQGVLLSGSPREAFPAHLPSSVQRSQPCVRGPGVTGL